MFNQPIFHVTMS